MERAPVMLQIIQKVLGPETIKEEEWISLRYRKPGRDSPTKMRMVGIQIDISRPSRWNLSREGILGSSRAIFGGGIVAGRCLPYIV